MRPGTATRGRPRTEGASLLGVWRQGVRRVLGHFRAVPFTLAVLGVFLATGAATGSFLSGPPESLLNVASVSAPGLRAGRWWSLFTSLFFATNPLAYLAAALMILLLLGLAERHLGTLRTAVFYFAGQFAAVTVFLLLTQLARYAGDGWLGLMVNARLIGPYAAVLAVTLAASGLLPTLWQRRLRTAGVSAPLLLVLYVGHAETVVGLAGALAGLAAGWWIQGDRGTLHRHRSTGRETRNLLALTVAIFAVGPILTAAVSSPTGPLALLRDVVLNPLPTLSQLEANCGGTVDVSCLEAGRAGFAGPLGLALAIVPVVLLLICADGMRQGRRLALRIAIIVQLAVTALAAVYLALFARIPHYPNRPHTAVMSSGFVHILPLVAVPLMLVVLLWANRRQFRVETAPRARRNLGVVVGGTWLVLAGGYAAAWLAAGGMDRDGGLLGLVAELARQYLPLPIPGTYSRIFQNRNAVEAFLFAYAGIIFWATALTAVWLVLLRRLHRTDVGSGDRDVARSLIRQGGDSLSWMALWEPNKYWFTADRRGGVAYQQHGNVALTLAGPFGPAALHENTAAGFMRYCAEHALIPCFYSCTDELWPMLQARGFRRVAVAQETRLAVRELEFKGKEWQNVRTALNRAGKTGVRAVWGRYSDLSAPLRAQLSEVSEEWAAQKPVPEMGFTLGGIDELDDDEVLCCLALDAGGQVQGVTSWLPVYDGGQLVSWTLDFMRRRGDAFPGVMEFLIASAVQELKRTVEFISLSGSPLAKDHTQAAARASAGEAGDNSTRENAAGDGTAGDATAEYGQEAPRDAGPEGLAGILDVVGRALEPVYGFRSLATFKSRFKPDYRTLYLYYQDPLQLPAMGRALSRAYLPGLSVRQSARLLRTLVG
ncbi:bifunctional lysylphosphatidylglycerol flippase/synthetase MprF [Pseudarthrobacter sp. S9]|uniref:bifunctional lysylphosphatidylglycerol flippase/synthetase MprF n=1 Tax=Pseudarthrobacter sp. S9 TaxID=3418421 RepID=UPI003CFF0265